jgi:hypothetical protein
VTREIPTSPVEVHGIRRAQTYKLRCVRDYWQGYGYDHIVGCPAVPRCTCGYVETMRCYFARVLPTTKEG